MDESILVPNAESFFAGSVLIPMGIKINKPVVLARLNEVIDEFNETYLETIDFLTQILPLAREQFGRSDNLLLPKTPSKKRHRKVIRDRSNQENIDPNIPPKASAEESSPVKRTTRSSRRNNPAPSQDEPTKKRNSKGRAKKSEQLKVAFVSESKVVVEVKLPAKVCTLKRTSSTSPVSIKPVKKKSKSSDELSLLDEDSLLKKQTSTPVNAEPLQMLSLSSIVDHSDTKPDANELVNVVEKDETNLLKSYELKAVKMDIDIKEKNEPPTGILVEIENNNEEKGGVILVLDSPPPVIKIPLVKVEPPTSILVNINETPPATNENVDKITNEAVAESAVINKIPGEIVNETIVKETPDKITNKVVVNEFPAKNGGDEQLNSESVVQPIGRDLGSPVQQLRRSKRLSEQINAAELAAEPLLEQKKQVDKPISVEKPTSDSQDDAPAQIVILVTPESKPVRRSTRRISKVSTGYKRRSSRRSSHQPGYFRKPVTLKQIEVHLNDVGINEVIIKPEPSATPELHKAVFLGSEHSSSESEDDAPKMFSSIPRSNIPHQSAKTDSSGDEPAEGTVAGIIQKINKKTLQNEQTSSFKTPNGIRKIKIGSAVQGSSHQNPPNVVGGSVKSFIERQSVKKLDANEIARQKKLDSQRKEEKDRERKDRAELTRKNWADQRKRKREEIQKRVAEAKATRAREEQDKKERQLEDERQMVYASKKARKKKEHEEETKKRLREQRTKEAEARRLKDNIERLERLQVREEDCKMYQEMLKRKQEQEEHDRKQRIQDEKRAHGQKQRERAREKEEERERLLREIKEREAKKLEKEEDKRKEKEEKERKQRDQDERQNKRIAQLIKDKMDQDKKLREEKLREENERKLRDEQRRREEQRAAMLEAVRTADSYLMTPPPAQTRKPATSENYDISDIRSDESTDDEDAPRKRVPYWAQGAALKSALLQQEEAQRMFEELASGFVPHAPDLEKIFTKKRKRFYQRTSSAHWNSPPLKV